MQNQSSKPCPSASRKREKDGAAESPPEVLFRATRNTDLRNHREGRLWFHSPAYYRTIEDPQLQDGLEAIGSHYQDGMKHSDISDPKRGRHLCPTYILCFSEDLAATRKYFAQPGSGTDIVQLINPEMLRNLIQDSVLPDCDVIAVKWRKVVYDKTMDVSEVPPPGGWTARKYWHKPAKFAAEKEWRLIIFFKPTMPIANDRLELHLGRSCGSLFHLLPK